MWWTIGCDAWPVCDGTSRALWQLNHCTTLHHHVTVSWPQMRNLKSVRLIKVWLLTSIQYKYKIQILDKGHWLWFTEARVATYLWQPMIYAARTNSNSANVICYTFFMLKSRQAMPQSRKTTIQAWIVQTKITTRCGHRLETRLCLQDVENMHNAWWPLEIFERMPTTHWGQAQRGVGILRLSSTHWEHRKCM